MGAYRGFWVWGIGTVAVLLPFLIFVAAGWPGDVNGCTKATTYHPPQPNTCYCEAFDKKAAEGHGGGVRQPVNTWFNLYSILKSFLVALFVYFDRDAGGGSSPIRTDSLYPDIYIFAVLFLGLGSMWFHGSLKNWGGVTDLLSMFIYAAFLVFYTIRRLWAADWFFYIFYPITVVLFTVIGALWQWQFQSLVLILILVAAYLTFEIIIWAQTGKVMQGNLGTIVLWVSAVTCIILATIFWALSQTGGPLCDPKSAFQPHGLLWHPLAGAMAVLLYFYWREDQDAAT
jgi:hypothetical protein